MQTIQLDGAAKSILLYLVDSVTRSVGFTGAEESDIVVSICPPDGEFVYCSSYEYSGSDIVEAVVGEEDPARGTITEIGYGWYLITLPAVWFPEAGTYLFQAEATGAEPGASVVLAVDATETPLLAAAYIEPALISAAGGNILIVAIPGEDQELDTVSASVIGPEGDPDEVSLTLSGGLYTGTAALAANATSDAVAYLVLVTAVSGSDSTTISAGSASVAGYVAAAAPFQFKAFMPGHYGTDTTPPTVVDITTTTMTAAGGTVTITARITDELGVAGASAKVVAPNSSESTVTLSNSSGISWTGTFVAAANTTYAAETYTVTVSAMDTSGNTTTAPAVSVVVPAKTDTTNPVIASVAVGTTSFLAAGGACAISASVTDDQAVRNAVASIGWPDGTSRSIALTHATGDTYAGTYTLPENTAWSAKDYTVTVTAYDVAENFAVSAGDGITVAGVIDSEAPEITDVTVDEESLLAAGGDVTISATVTDNQAVESVTATVTLPDESTVEVPMALSQGDVYSGVYEVPENTGFDSQTYTINVTATDVAENVAEPTGSAEVVVAGVPDVDGPEVSQMLLSETDLSVTGGEVTISADVTDNQAVAEVFATVTLPDESTEEVAMEVGEGNNYFGTYEVPANTAFTEKVYAFAITAIDVADVSTTVPAGAVTVAAVADEEAPLITDPDADPSSLDAEGGDVTISATVTDNQAVESVTATVTLPDESYTSVSLLLIEDNTYSGVYDAPENTGQTDAEYTIVINAKDVANNDAIEVGGISFTVKMPLPPVPAAPHSTAVSTTAISIAWAAGTGGGPSSTYSVERAEGEDEELLTWTEVASGLETAAFADSNLSQDTQYWYRVAAHNTSGASGYSDVLIQTTLDE